MFVYPLIRGGQHHRKKVVNITGTGGQDGSEYTILTQHEFGMGYGKAFAVTWIPTLMVVIGKWIVVLF